MNSVYFANTLGGARTPQGPNNGNPGYFDRHQYGYGDEGFRTGALCRPGRAGIYKFALHGAVALVSYGQPRSANQVHGFRRRHVLLRRRDRGGLPVRVAAAAIKSP